MSLNIKYISFFDNSGYGIAAKSYLKAIMDSDIEVTWTPMVIGKSIGMTYEPFQGRKIGEGPFDTICNKPVDYDTVLIHTVPEYYTYWKEKEKDKYLIGYTVWETTKPPDHWKELINKLDHLLVPTKWNKSVFREHGVTIPIDVIPHLSEFQGNISQNTELLGLKRDRFLFYTISPWTERKAICKLIDAYSKAFSQQDNVELLIKTSKSDLRKRRNIFLRYLGYTYPSVRKAFDHCMKRFENSAKITLIADDSKSTQYIQSLHTRGDCYVSLCRGEGWGMGSFEAARYGKPVVMTGFGGQTAYLHTDYSWPIDYELIPFEDQNKPRGHRPGERWAEPDVEQAANYILYIYEHQEEARRKGEKLKKYVTDNFSNEKTTRKLISLLKAV